jgi:DNA polymerase III epsilon subunit-like protein
MNLNGNMLASIDVETTGLLAGVHEIVQIGLVPLDGDLNPCENHRPFYHHICPQYPENAQKAAFNINGLDLDWLINNGLDPWRAADLFDDYFQALELPFGKRIVPLAHNWAFERAFLLNWLGPETFDQFFFIHPRDTQIFGACINDAAVYHGKKIPFNELSLTYMCRKFGIHNERSHDALADSLAGAKLYQELILGFGHK